jgi:hypothetical protein
MTMRRILFSPRNTQYIFIKIFECYQKATENQDQLQTSFFSSIFLLCSPDLQVRVHLFWQVA